MTLRRRLSFPVWWVRVTFRFHTLADRSVLFHRLLYSSLLAMEAYEKER